MSTFIAGSTFLDELDARLDDVAFKPDPDFDIDRALYLVDFTPGASSEDPDAFGDREPADTWEEANAISSEIAGTNMHAPVLDLDYSAELVPSSTPGHFHLYLNRAVTWPAYKKLLLALAECGLIEDGYVSASIDRQATFVRKPGVTK